MKLTVITISLAVLCVFGSSAQTKTPILERKISLDLPNEKLPDALSAIASVGQFSFSYNSTIISRDKIVSVSASDNTVREILNKLFNGSIDYKEKGNHLILTPATPKQRSSSSFFFIEGYVKDFATKEIVANASIYDKKSIVSAVTDNYGYFKIKIDNKAIPTSMIVSKKDYLDTVININSGSNQYFNIHLSPHKTYSTDFPSEVAEPDSSTRIKEPLSLPYSDEPNVQNINDTLYSDIQISFLPFVGSNGGLSGNVINNYSINILGGYSMGTRQIELGFFFNLDRGDVSWLQIAGFGNLVGRNVYGVQASGFFNINGGETKAAQLTGFGNINFRDFQGVQIAGFGNLNLKAADGAQIAGFGNISQAPSKGVQVSGFGNLNTADYNGSQIAGAANIATQSISGSQIAGLFNYGKNVKGSQIGLFNCADSLSGIPIGLVSYVRSGYHKLEVSADEVFYTNVSFRTGSRKFYNIILAGIKPERTVNNTNVWTFGYGVGTARRLSNRLQLNIDATSQHVSKGDFTSQLSLLNKVHLGLDYKLTRKFSAYAGLTMNGYLTNSGYADYPILFSDYQPAIFSDNTFSNGNNLKMWVGAKVGLRFF